MSAVPVWSRVGATAAEGVGLDLFGDDDFSAAHLHADVVHHDVRQRYSLCCVNGHGAVLGDAHVLEVVLTAGDCILDDSFHFHFCF